MSRRTPTALDKWASQSRCDACGRFITHLPCADCPDCCSQVHNECITKHWRACPKRHWPEADIYRWRPSKGRGKGRSKGESKSQAKADSAADSRANIARLAALTLRAATAANLLDGKPDTMASVTPAAGQCLRCGKSGEETQMCQACLDQLWQLGRS